MNLGIFVGLTAMVFFPEVSGETDGESCYGPGDIAGSVIGTFLVTLALAAAALLVYKWYWRSRKGKHLVLMTDTENPNDQYAFDNPCFREATPVKHSIQDEKNTSKLEKNKWLGWSPLHSFGVHKNEKLTSLDDSHVKDSHLKVVSLKGHDFTGLGFNICGNMRDGIFVKDVLHRGPAFESGCINSGDRIDSVCISFRNMVFEDALTILSYASPYEVQVQVENDSHSRPSTLIRSKRESNAVSSAERIRHPKYNRSQSISHLAEIGKSSNKWFSQQSGYTSEKNRINQSLNKSDSSNQNDYPTLKISNDHKKETSKLVKNAVSKLSPKNIKTNPSLGDKKSTEPHNPFRDDHVDESKMQKFGIKVLPININPKMGIQSVTGGKKPKQSSLEEEDKPSIKADAPKLDDQVKPDEVDGSKDNVKSLLSKGLHNLKEKINQNSLGRKKKSEQNEESKNQGNDEVSTEEVPVPKTRLSVHSIETQINVPEEVARAGDVARNNRKSIIDPDSKKNDDETKANQEIQKVEDHTESDTSSESGSPHAADEAKRPKRSKGKAPAPPQNNPKQTISAIEVDAITNEADLIRDDKNIFEPMEKETLSRVDNHVDALIKNERSYVDYDSDSDIDIRDDVGKRNGTMIELSATQVTVHHSPTSDTGNNEEIETNRKAASLGDLSKLESDHTLSVVLERAVSLDLADGASQCGKKRKAPLPPPEEFPAVFDEIGYRKEPRLENSLGLNTFQRRLKKSSDFGTLEDALQDGPKSLEIEIKKNPLDVTEANNSNIQEFSSWLEDCRKQKNKDDEPELITTSKSLVNVNMSENEDYPVQNNNVTFSVNGKNYPEDEEGASESNGPSSWTVLVISQPNSLEPVMNEGVSMNVNENGEDSKATPGKDYNADVINDSEPADDEPAPKLPTSPMPVVSKTTLSTPLSKSLTYVTEIKVSTSDKESGEPSDVKKESINLSSETSGDSRNNMESPVEEEHSFSSLVSKFSKLPNEEITVNNESVFNDSRKRSGDYEISKIPIRTMKSETGQKVLATIQSLAAKESPPKNPEVEYAKRVASLFTASPKIETGSPRQNDSGFYLSASSKKPAPNRKVPPTVPPRKVDTTLASGKSTVTVALPGKGAAPVREKNTNQDRSFVTFSSFIPKNEDHHESGPKIVNWNERRGKGDAINGGHVQVQSGVVNLPVKTSATKIVFESKDFDKDEL